ncbi:hypothetical protein GJ496_007944 [Pomphorhynchus laevis]|nr:hypothetical protein GJ496_007944 [Pomphorhynchus laevis]
MYILNFRTTLRLSLAYPLNRMLLDKRFIAYSSAHRYAKTIGRKDFDSFIDSRIDQAQKSVLFQIASSELANDLYRYCSEFGAVMKMFQFCNQHRDSVLVEFATRRSVKNLIDSVQHFGNISRHPVVSRNLYFGISHRMNNKNDVQYNQSGKNLPESLCSFIKPRTSLVNDLFDNINRNMQVSDQIKKFYFATRLHEGDIRLRFFVSSCIQDTFSGLFPDCVCLPFGSTVSSLGRFNSDLDCVLCFEDYRRPTSNNKDQHVRFLTKRSYLGDRHQAQIYLKIVSSIIKHFTPECGEVQIVLPAKVPIVRFHQRLADLWCDMSMSDFSGSYYMSKLLWTLTGLDKRLATLFFVIRQWAQSAKVTLPFPGPWISNFQLALLLLYFAQSISSPLIPKLYFLANSDQDHQVCIGRRSDTSKNQHSLENLLRDFFLFYSDYNSLPSTISLHTSTLNSSSSIAGASSSVTMDDRHTEMNHLSDIPVEGTVKIQNPLYPTVCASKNVTIDEFQRFCNCCSLALQLMPQECPSDGQWFSDLMCKPPTIPNENHEERESKAYTMQPLTNTVKDLDNEITVDDLLSTTL